MSAVAGTSLEGAPTVATGDVALPTGAVAVAGPGTTVAVGAAVVVGIA